MSWSEGSELMGKIITSIAHNVADANARKEMYKDFIPYFEDNDCDTLHECLGEDPAFDEAYAEISFFAEDDEDEYYDEDDFEIDDEDS